VYDELTREEEAFTATLAKGQRLLDDLLAAAAPAALDASASGAAAPEGGERRGRARARGGGGGVLAGADAFLLYDSYGFPIELTVELAEARGIKVRGGRAPLAGRGRPRRACSALSLSYDQAPLAGRVRPAAPPPRRTAPLPPLPPPLAASAACPAASPEGGHGGL
jgi:hypothetical protein